MHEFSTMNQIVNTILEEGKRHNAHKITKVILEIGELTFLGEEQLRFAFDLLTKDTILEGANLDIQKKGIKVKCSCGYEGGVEYEEKEEFHLFIPLLRCPRCNEEVEIIQGRECVIKSVRMEIEDVPTA